MKDQLNRDLNITSTPRRIVSLVPSLTELLVDLGLEDKIVGVTKFCIHPSELRPSVEVIGGTKTLKVDKIQQLKSDFILANKEENTLEDITELSENHSVYISDINSIEDLYALIKDLNKIFNIEEVGDKLIDEIHEHFQDFKIFTDTLPNLKVAYFIWREPWMVVGSSTFINYMLKLNKFENVYQNLPRYPEVNIDELQDVDYVLLSSEPFPFQEKHKAEINVPAEHIKIVDGEFFSWYGSRLLKAFEYFKTLRHNL